MVVRGFFGGTFDPIHDGHTQALTALTQCIAVDQWHLLPAAVPPHRAQPAASAQHRLAMVDIVCQQHAGWIADDWELQQQGPSYTANTLQQRRQQFPQDALLFVIGMDSLLSLDSWYNWQQLTELAHLVVLPRPGYSIRTMSATIEAFVTAHRCQANDLQRSRHGGVWLADIPQFDVSATAIRKQLAQRQFANLPLQAGVIDYIRQQQLYQNL
ncbi:nicotinate-nucleotide adenylyltransferase [Idiomarina tyrosinivorans]|uniref:Probable nicotinate-nucleotide adenylyltransferase n=1 Tax=Idiomarina tyrosinivorans TaxID=1445662 RepID=A0A432ZRE6_9GAMM|nr:nicotinate-nucleotide adenylyltransferase [Idiomarina tyrosinivorans]RUO80453.1 nicotinate-nucleotide adenylyltransferase [Idiomarina tyrosinivorans]